MGYRADFTRSERKLYSDAVFDEPSGNFRSEQSILPLDVSEVLGFGEIRRKPLSSDPHAEMAFEKGYKKLNRTLEDRGIEPLEKPKETYLSTDHPKEVLTMLTPFGLMALPLPGGGLAYTDVERDVMAFSEDMLPWTKGFYETKSILKDSKQKAELLYDTSSSKQERGLMEYLIKLYDKELRRMEFYEKNPDMALKELQKVAIHEGSHKAAYRAKKKYEKKTARNNSFIKYVLRKYRNLLRNEDMVNIIEQNAIDTTDEVLAKYYGPGEKSTRPETIYDSLADDFSKRKKRTGLTGLDLIEMAASDNEPRMDRGLDRLYPEAEEGRLEIGH